MELTQRAGVGLVCRASNQQWPPHQSNGLVAFLHMMSLQSTLFNRYPIIYCDTNFVKSTFSIEFSGLELACALGRFWEPSTRKKLSQFRALVERH